MNDNFVYVMSDVENYKIGVSKNPVQRAVEVSRKYKRPVSLLLSINCIDAYGCEKYLHHKYKNINVGGEWFDFGSRAFLEDVWYVCTNNLIGNGAFISIDSKRNQTSDKLNEFVDSCKALTYIYAFELLDDKEKYNGNTIPNMLRNLGCLRVSRAKGVFYVTPKGLEEGLEKERVDVISSIANLRLFNKENS